MACNKYVKIRFIAIILLLNNITRYNNSPILTTKFHIKLFSKLLTIDFYFQRTRLHIIIVLAKLILTHLFIVAHKTISNFASINA